MYKLLICIICFLFCVYSGNIAAQVLDVNKVTVDDVEWSEGSVTLTNGTVLSGLLRLNTKTGLLGYENGSVSKSFTPRNVVSFSYFDVQEQKQRRFLSLAYNDPKPKDDGALAVMKKERQRTKEELAVPKFYEILVVCKTFALLSTVGRLNIKQTTGGYVNTPAGGTHSPASKSYMSPSITYSSNETLLILSEDGTIEPALEITNKEVDRSMFDSNRTKGKTDESVIEKYTAPYYDRLVAYAKERNLKFKEREDLIQIFEYYQSLSMN